MISDNKLIEISLPEVTDYINIYPLADLHIGDAHTELKLWRKFKERILADPRSYIVIAGDMVNNATRNSVSDIYAAPMRPSEQKKWLSEQLKDLTDRILCLVPGNHEHRSRKEVDDCPLYDVACKLDIEDRYRPTAAYIYLRIGEQWKRRKKPVPYTLCVQHGAGGGIYTGSGVNRTERYAHTYDGLDVLITGHTHKAVITAPEKIVIDVQNRCITRRGFFNIIASPWQVYGDYALRSMMLPSGHRPQILKLHANEKQMIATMEI